MNIEIKDELIRKLMAHVLNEGFDDDLEDEEGISCYMNGLLEESLLLNGVK